MRFSKTDLLFPAIVLFLCSWHLDGSHNANSVSRAALVAAIVEDGSIKIDRFQGIAADKAEVNGHFYSEKAPLPALIVAPFWWIADLFISADRSDPSALPDGLLMLGGFLCGSLPLALIMLWTWRRIRSRSTPINASWMAVLPFFGSFLFAYSGSFYGHLIAALFMLIAWRKRIEGRSLQAGIFASAAVLCEYSLFIFPLIWILQDLFTRRWKDLPRLVIGGMPAVIILLAMNFSITGDPLSLPYSNVSVHADSTRFYGLAFPSLEALIGLSIGTFRGMFIFAPLTLLCSIAIFRHMTRLGSRSIVLHPLVLPSLLLVPMIASHSMWWGGWAIGPRHLTSVVVLLFAAGVPLLPRKPIVAWSFLVLSLIGLAINFAAKNTVWYGLPTEEKDPIGAIILPAFFEGDLSTMQWPVLIGLQPETSTCIFLVLFISSLFALLLIERKKPVLRS